MHLVGEIESLLRQEYGDPTIVANPASTEYVWNKGNEADQCVLYKPLIWSHSLDERFSQLKQLYGDARGGLLAGDSMRIATLDGPELRALYTIDQLRSVPVVASAIKHCRGVEFFMDAANVWYYGVKDNELYCLDAETGEFDCLGPVMQVLRELLIDWVKAAQDA